MKAKIGLILSIMVMSIGMYAQNQFVYIRYNPGQGNSSAIVGTVDKLMAKSSGKVVVFVSNAASPIIAANSSEWEEVRSELLRMQSAYEYYAEDESAILNQYYTTLFAESVDKKLHIKGKDDESWVCTFIISEESLHSDEFEALAENISVNELAKRMSVDVLIYSDSPRLSPAEIAANTMFKFNITE
ncbi:MAG: hypothetical protein IJU36_09775 [Paludibacteraceae bacterium]|nr:hypothetical protein [Paludibacteraceae bacterium]